jgi:hypothetical protein
LSEIENYELKCPRQALLQLCLLFNLLVISGISSAAPVPPVAASSPDWLKSACGIFINEINLDAPGAVVGPKQFIEILFRCSKLEPNPRFLESRQLDQVVVLILKPQHSGGAQKIVAYLPAQNLGNIPLDKNTGEYYLVFSGNDLENGVKTKVAWSNAQNAYLDT